MSEIASRAPTELLAADDGKPYRPHEVLNELAEWLEPRWLDDATADLMQHLYETALELLPPVERERLSVAARRWTREYRGHQWDQPTLPFY